jgi:hypothetical protein
VSVTEQRVEGTAASSDEKMQRNVGVILDKIVSIEMRDRRPSQGVIDPLYRAALDHFGEPLTMRAARLLVDRLTEGDVAIIVTGAGVPDYLPVGETDGPPGAAAVAKILRYGLGVVPVILTQPEYLENVRATTIAGGVGLRDVAIARKVPFSGSVLAFPGDDTAPEAAARLVKELSPKAVIAIEALGPNAKGVAHTSEGRPGDPARGRFEHLFDLAAKAGIVTVGIGDNGNEIGFGSIIDDVHRLRTWAKVCQCPCQGGMATRVAVDALIVAGVYNWGAYGLEAAIATVIGQPELIHNGDVERFMLQESVRTGAADGRGPGTMTEDGTPLEVTVAILELLKATVTMGIRAPRKRPY